MMVPFDGSAPSQQQQGVAPAPLPRPPMPPGHQPQASPGMHQQQMNPAAYGMHRQASAGMPGGQPYNMPPQNSPGGRHQSFGGMPNQGPQGQYSNHPPLHSPAHQQQQQGGMHPNVPHPQQMHRNSSQSRSHMGMPMQDQMRQTSQGGMGQQQYMGNSMGNSMNNMNTSMNTSMNNSMNNTMNMGNNMGNNMGMNNAMGNSMNTMNTSMNNNMGGSMNSSMNNNMGNAMGNSMGNTMGNNMGGTMGNNMMNNSMGNNMGGDMGNSMGSSMGNNMSNSMGTSMNSGGSSGLNGNWQTDKDTPRRREMIQHIVKMLKKDKNGSPEFLNKLPQMAKQLEVSLYRNARSLEAYMDMSTLKHRLQQIAVEVSRKARNQDSGRDRSERSQSYNNNMRNDSRSSGSGSPFMGMAGGSSQQRAMSSSSQRGMDDMSSSGMSNSAMPNMGGMNSGMSTNMNSNIGGNMNSMNPGMTSNVNSMNAGMNPMSNNMNSMNSGMSSNMAGGNMAATTSANRQQSAGGMSAQNRNDPEWKVRIRHKQQRLLLLHHSAKCPHEDGQCTVTPHCADMKRLWRHMEGCKDNNCRVSHCFSSRAILSHYRKCKDPACPACGPVRETVRKSQSRNQSSQNRRMPNSNAGNPMMNPLGDGSGRGMSGSNAMMGSNNNNMNSFSSNNPMSSNFQQPTQNSMAPPGGSSMNSGMNFNSSSSGQQMQQQQQFRSSSTTTPSASSVQPMMGGPSSTGPSSTQRAPSSSASNSGAMGSSSGGASGSGGDNSRRNDSEWQKVRHKQQRLLLLRHASRCQYEPSKCPVTPHCASMKKLWEHIAHCKNQQCTVPHCMSSRYVLSHYRRCKDSRCPACGPVRETIRKSHEKERGRGGQAGQSSSSTSFDMEVSRAPQPGDAMPSGMDPTSMGQGSSTTSPEYVPAPKRTKTDHTPSATSGATAPPVPSQSQGSSKQSQKGVRQPVSSDPIKPAGPIGSAVKPAATSSAVAPSSGASATSAAPVPSSGPAVKKETPAASSGSGGKSEDRSLLNSFTVEQLQTHLASLNRATQLPPAKLKAKCTEVLKGLQQHQHGWVFNCPVDPVELGLPDYFEIIKKPMDLGTVHKRLDQGTYHAIHDFRNDVNLTFENAMAYNEKGSVVYDMAKELKTKFEADHKKMMMELDAEDQERRQNERACTLCGCEKLLFEPPVFFCNGMNCQSKRIRRNSHFYIGGNNQYFWCNQCYNELNDKDPIELIDLTLQKPELKKKKNDEVHEESWVQCDVCEKWIHQICGLFNTRQNREHNSEYCCPMCLLEKRTKNPCVPPAKPPTAAELPRTKLSEMLEKHVARRIKLKKRVWAEDKVKNDGLSMEDALKAVDKIGAVTIRQVTSMDRKLEVRELMKKRYEYKKYPDEFPFRCKCIVVFQHIDGVDVVLFALYVYEHGEDNPEPNKRCVYISYLDSVHFMRPRKLRTFVYHEILISYLDYVRQRGYATAHIWACPPLKGDDYIFYAKPEDQKTPRDSRLRQWYIDMLEECQRRSIVGKVTNMYDLYFANEKLDATAVPYLEGDYFPGEAENIIKMLEEGNGKKGGGAGKKNKKKNQNKSKSRGGTRSTGVDEEALLASGMMDGVKDLSELDRDQVMVKLGETIQPMKDSFIVAFLAWSGAKEEEMEVPEAIQKYRDEHPEEAVPLSGSKRDADGNNRDDVPLDKNGRPVKVIDDDSEDLDCEFLNNRQAFLNLCRGNHYQFDELRRAKHTSMMVLWHLHNRDAPKFVQQCVACSREILSGKRYHCPSCPDYDLCETCYKDPNVNRGSCTHKLQPIAVESNQEQESSSSGLTEAQRQQRQRNLMLHIQLIEHASRCTSSSCSSTNCAKMKNYLQHSRMCRVKVQGGCRICKRIWTLLRIHAQKCKDRDCPIPQCNAIREKMRQLQKQQQAMDDRRRQEMNRHYRMGAMAGAAG